MMDTEGVMAIPVKLTEVVSAMDMQTDDCCAFLNKGSGEVIVVSGHSDDVEMWDEHFAAELRDGQAVVDYLFESKDWVELPSKFDIHDWDMMRRFSDSQAGEVREVLLEAIHGRGAFRMFRSAVHNLSMQDEWYAYRDSEYEKLAVECLEEHSIPFERS